MPTLEEIRGEVKARKIKPSEIFDSFELLQDRAIRDRITREADMEADLRERRLNEQLAKEAEEEKKKKGDASHIADEFPGSSGSNEDDSGDEDDEISHIPD